MDSGIEELSEALNRLSSETPRGDDYWPSGLSSASRHSNSISNVFININNALVSGWESTSDFFKEIDDTVQNDIEDVRYLIANYVDLVRRNEMEEERKLKENQDTAKGILDNLGL